MISFKGKNIFICIFIVKVIKFFLLILKKSMKFKYLIKKYMIIINLIILNIKPNIKQL